MTDIAAIDENNDGKIRKETSPSSHLSQNGHLLHPQS